MVTAAPAGNVSEPSKMAKGCSAALAVIWIATVAHALTTPVSTVLTSTGGLGAAPAPGSKKRAEGDRLGENDDENRVHQRPPGKTERELGRARSVNGGGRVITREQRAVGRLQQKTARPRSYTRKADEEIALLKQNTLKELESTKAQEGVLRLRQAATKRSA